MDLDIEISKMQAEKDRLEIRGNMLKTLCKRKDPDAFDMTFNASDDLRHMKTTDGSSLEERLKNKAFFGQKVLEKNTKEKKSLDAVKDADKIKDLNKQIELSFAGLYKEVEDLYGRAVALLLENIKTLKQQRDAIRSKEREPLKINRDMDNSMSSGAKIELRENEPIKVVEKGDKKEKEGKRGWFGWGKESKPKATVEKVSMDVVHNELEQMDRDNLNNNTYFDDEAYRKYNNKTKEKASENQKNYESKGMEQEQAMQMSGPSFGPRNSDKK